MTGQRRRWIRPHVFMANTEPGVSGCQHCPLGETNTTVHISDAPTTTNHYEIDREEAS